jgi:predicted TIM-barrel fold metal-dependent hydrolase
MIIDAHAHAVNNEIGNVEVLLEQYKKAGIDKGILVAGGMLDVRKMTKYITGEIVPKIGDIPNNLVEDALKKYPDKFYGFYNVNPHEGKAALEQLEHAVKRGFKGLKLAPMVHQFSLSCNTVLELAELCGDLNIPFYSHVVFSAAASTNKMYNLAKQFPKTTFILGHMGFGAADTDAVEYAKECDNLYLESSQGSHVILTQAYSLLGSKKLIFGSEFPMYHPKVSLEAVLNIGCTDSDLEDICCNNILELINEK